MQHSTPRRLRARPALLSTALLCALCAPTLVSAQEIAGGGRYLPIGCHHSDRIAHQAHPD